MTRDQKIAAVAELKDSFANNNFFYVADSSSMTVEEINNFRRKCFESGITVKVCKNTLIQKALETFDEEKGYAPIYDV
ncbi:MAG: 50S ribosomal protein L10, partial [Saprospiraceae bacterium]